MKSNIILITLLLLSCANQPRLQEVDNKKEVLKRGVQEGDTIRFVTIDNQSVTIKVKEITDTEVIGETNDIKFSDISTYYAVPKEQPQRGTATTGAWWYLSTILIWVAVLI